MTLIQTQIQNLSFSLMHSDHNLNPNPRLIPIPNPKAVPNHNPKTNLSFIPNPKTTPKPVPTHFKSE